ncbi:hypothetical protein LTR85_005934 [Meristemomyces frigidus]|nr:hypothetical protein LTR85_005934 [Meristemomyces frigidus]
MARVPFAPLDNPRLQHLASAKNRQNGMITQKTVLGGKANITSPKIAPSPSKRPFEPATFDDFDGENVDPAVFSSPTKKSKGDAFDKPVKPFTFSLTPAKSMPPPPSRLSTPVRANMSSPRAPMTAPAGRSPKRKSAGINKNRRTSAPFTRIDPPFASRGSSTLPFSLDAALSGTFSTPTPKESVGATIQESMPKNWFFEIYEDAPEEEAANLMEHSTLTLDLSSDEEGSKRERDDRGKENMPPAGYDAPAGSRVGREVVGVVGGVERVEIVRKKVVQEEMDDGERSPLSDLETEAFIPEGLNKDSYVMVLPTPEKVVAGLDVKELFAAPMPTKDASKKRSASAMLDIPVVDVEGEVKGEIIVWEDSPASQRSATPVEIVGVEVKGGKEVEVYDENAAPAVDEVA